MKNKFIIMAKKIGQEIARTSEDPHRKVGAVILNEEGRILSTGYNGLIQSKNVNKSFWKNRDSRRGYMIHAEANALSCISRYENPYFIYVTLLPCGYCANLIACYGIKHVIYSEEYEHDCSSIDIFKFYKIKCQKI
jgi:dCMP deaminase